MSRFATPFAWATRLTPFVDEHAHGESRPLAFAPPSSGTGIMESDA